MVAADGYWQGTWPDDFSNWKAPDIAASVTFADCAAGRDAAMEMIKHNRFHDAGKVWDSISQLNNTGIRTR